MVFENRVDALVLDVVHPLLAGFGVVGDVLPAELTLFDFGLVRPPVPLVEVGQGVQVFVAVRRVATVHLTEVFQRLLGDVGGLPVVFAVVGVVGVIAEHELLGMVDVIAPVGQRREGGTHRHRPLGTDVVVLGKLVEHVVRGPVPQPALLFLVVVRAVVVTDQVVDHRPVVIGPLVEMAHRVVDLVGGGDLGASLGRQRLAGRRGLDVVGVLPRRQHFGLLAGRNNTAH